MLYSIGYQGMKAPAELIDQLERVGVKILIDVRSKPYSTKAGFSRGALSKTLESAGIYYLWSGRTLGGFSEIYEDDIRDLASWQQDKTACLMCMEKNPAKCHRDYEIAHRLKKYRVTVNHIL